MSRERIRILFISVAILFSPCVTSTHAQDVSENRELIKGEVAIKPGDIIQLGTEVIPWGSYFHSV